MSPEAKLNELRAKTDRQLITLIGNQLDRGLSWGSAGSLERARQAYSEAMAWLPLLSRANESGCRHVEQKAARLRQMLGHAPAYGVRVQTACS